MANCPHCGKKLRLYHWRPNCPACGVNMVYFASNERLLAETERTEIEHAGFQPKLDRAKAAFFGSPWAIARLAITILSLVSAFLPLFRLEGPRAIAGVNAMAITEQLSEDGAVALRCALKEEYAPLFRLAAPALSASGGAVQVYNHLSGEGFGSVFSAAAKGDPLSLAAALLLASLALVLVCLICTPMSLGKHGKGRNLLLNLALLGCGAGAAVCFLRTDIPSSLPGYTSGALGWGAFVYLGLLAALLVYNLFLAKRGMPIKRTVSYVGGLPSDEYFGYVKQGMSELEIRRKMADALTKMQDETRARAAAAAEREREEKAAWK